MKIKLIRGHTNGISAGQFIDNDRRIFTCSNDLTARIWDSATGQELVKYADLHEGNISTAKVSQDNSKLDILNSLFSICVH